MSAHRPGAWTNRCLWNPSTGAVAVRRRMGRTALCWERPVDQLRRRRHTTGSRYPRVGRT